MFGKKIFEKIILAGNITCQGCIAYYVKQSSLMSFPCKVYDM